MSDDEKLEKEDKKESGKETEPLVTSEHDQEEEKEVKQKEETLFGEKATELNKNLMEEYTKATDDQDEEEISLNGVSKENEDRGNLESSEILKAGEKEKESIQTDDEEENESNEKEDPLEEDLLPDKSSVPLEDTLKIQDESRDNRKFRQIFFRPLFAEPRHPIFSSPFAKHICRRAFGPKKPKWYHSLEPSQLYLFKDIMNCVEVGRGGFCHFNKFLDALQDFDPTVTRPEVLEVLDSMEPNEFEEVDFGKFFYLLAYRDQTAEYYPENIEDCLSRRVVTPRQCLILSAISYFVLISSPQEIQRYYYQNTKRKGPILHYHLEETRLRGLSEKQMEIKQRNAVKPMRRLYILTGSPYALPVPFVPCFKKGKVYREWKRRRYSYPTIALPSAKRPIYRPLIPLKVKRELGERLQLITDEDKIVSQITYGRIPIPEMRFPHKIIKQLRKGNYTADLKDYIMDRSEQAVDEFRNRLKEAAVVYARKNLKPILRQGFPTKADRDTYIECYKRYLPLKVSDVQNFSLWVKPAGYRLTDLKKSLDPQKFAFGKNIPLFSD